MKLLSKIYKIFKDKNLRHSLQSDKVQQEITKSLLERLTYLKIKPKNILSWDKDSKVKLAALYPQAQILEAELNNLPDGYFDLIFANQLLALSGETQMFREINRIMAQDACLMFTTFGPDTFKELQTFCPEEVKFLDMHDIGDLLVNEHFVDPVMDVEWLTASYKSFEKLATAVNKYQKLSLSEDGFKNLEPKYTLTYEVIFGHAWKGSKHNTEHGVETYIPISKIARAK